LVSLGNYIRIEGHTDNVPIPQFRFPRIGNYPRKGDCGDFSLGWGLWHKPELISAAGYAEYRPCAQNDTEEGKARNRPSGCYRSESCWPPAWNQNSFPVTIALMDKRPRRRRRILFEFYILNAIQSKARRFFLVTVKLTE